ncbi:hypothetical protein Nepgr_022593 [Nepenthes gracilis]|uniref:Uncharacterized protein n=1 Tax=Nepenthes gracilis TaxID=150966 RepID=A0AAD3T2V8_NEPGR|nr:hypothetical protein Nepgr_022593 [Nepenthes gracilis]
MPGDVFLSSGRLIIINVGGRRIFRALSFPTFYASTRNKPVWLSVLLCLRAAPAACKYSLNAVKSIEEKKQMASSGKPIGLCILRSLRVAPAACKSLNAVKFME